jgi:hypothetical protein
MITSRQGRLSLLLFVSTFIILHSTFFIPHSYAATIQLPQTGQTGCWDVNGNPVGCANIGQDGDKLKGVASPVPRFSDNGNGTVTDNQSGLIWLQNANCTATVGGIAKADGYLVWQNALTWSNGLASGACGLTDGSVAGDWRLPNRKELQSLIDRQNSYPALPTGHPFSNVQADIYWSSSSYAGYTGSAWTVYMSVGIVGIDGKGYFDYVWPVRAGQVGNSVISVSPASKDYGVITTNTSSTAQTFTLSNSGSALIVSGIATTGGDSGQFAINPGDGTGGTCGSLTPTIALNASCTVSVTFNPTSAGAKASTLRISSNDPVTPNKDVALTGTGVLPTFTIGTGVTGSGTITCNPSATVNQGDSTTCTATPDAGNYVASVTVDSTAVPAAANTASYAQLFNNVTASHTMTATFSARYTVTYNGNDSSSGIVPTDAATYLPGATVTALDNSRTLVKTGFTFGGWNSAVDGSGTTYAVAETFAIAGNTTLYAKWVINGTCGSSYGAPFTVIPATNLCTSGTESAVTGSGPWTWSCNGSNGGTSASCWSYLQGTVVLPKTGQTACYDTDGNVISCAGTGQDGDKQMGAALTDPVFTDNGATVTDKVYGMTWSKDAAKYGAVIQQGINAPITRFTDNNNGTQTDNLTGLIWLKDANCFGDQNWINALNAANTLVGNNSQCGLNDGSVAGDWRLPNINELASLPTNYSGSPSAFLSDPAQGFTNVQATHYVYWSSSSYVGTSFALYVHMIDGIVYLDYKSDGGGSVWPVRAGQSGSLGSLTINKVGSGSVSSSPAGIACGATCSASFAAGQSVSLTATADSGSSFASWTGCDSINGDQCTVAATRAKSVTATFNVKSNQTIAFNSTTVTYGDAPLNLNTLAAGGSSGSPVTFALVSGSGSLSGTNNATLTITGAGDVVLRASQAGSTTYNAAADVDQTITVSKATATVTLGSLAATYDGTAKSASATTNPVGKTVNFTYDGSATSPTNAGSYAVVGTINDTNYQGTANGNLVISKATATVTLGSLAATYDGTAKSASATTTPTGKTVTFTYDGSATVPTNAGSYAVVGTINDTNYQGTSNGSLVISKATATVTLGSLAATYDGTAKSASATTNPVGKTVTFTYDGSATSPTNAGSFAVVCTINDTNYQGTANGNLVISKAAAVVTLGNLAATYDGTAKSASATTNPVGKTVTFTYDGSATVPINAGSYAVVGTINDTNYQGTANGNMVISKATATVTLGSLAVTYDGTAKAVSATTNPVGKTVTFTYDGSATVPINADSYVVIGAINDTNYQGTANGTLVIGKATATVTLGSLVATYDGTAKSASATTNPVGKTVTFTYDGSATAPTNAGSYAVVGTINDTNYQGTANGNLVISKAAAVVTLGNLAVTYDGTAKSVSATTNPVGKTVNFTYDGSAAAPTNAGSYAVVGTINDTNYQGTANGNLVISKASATVTLGSLAATYDGTAKSASATTNPVGKTVTFTYDGSATAPTNAGSYAVVGTINDTNYQGTANGSLVISKATATVTLGSLAATYDGTAKNASATTTPVGKTVTFTYDSSATAPTNAGSFAVVGTINDTNYQGTANGSLVISKATATVTLGSLAATYDGTANAGSYAVVGTINDTNYQGTANGSLVISKATATVTLGSLAATYDGTAKSASATTNPVGRTVTFTYDGSATAPTNAASYAVVGAINDTNYQGTVNGNLVISKATATVTLGSLAVTFDNTAKNATATTNPVGKTVTFTYDGSTTAPANAGTYAVVGAINDTNYQGTANGSLVISKATATVTLGSLAAIYDGTAKSASATTNPVGKTVNFTYDGSATAPTNAGSYAVVGTINDTNYQGTANGNLVISKATATVTLGSLAATYDGSAKSASATTNPVGKTVTFTYDGSATAPTNAGSYVVVGTINDTNYQGTANGSLVISKATATVTLGNLAATYDGTAKNATATTNPVGKTVTFTYDGSATTPTSAGSYVVVGTISDTNYQGTANGTLVIGKATATVTLGSLAATYDGTAKSASANTNPVGKTVTFTYDGSATVPINAGSYAVVGTINDTNYQGTANGSLVIGKATATVTLGSLAATYDGTAKNASATTTPVGKIVTFTYDGSATALTNAGSFAVVGTINDTNYQGTANGNLVISKAAAVVTLGNLAATYDGTAKSASATTNPVGKIVTFTYDGSATVPINAGSYAVVGTINDTNYQGTANGNLVISKASATVTLGSLAATYDGTAKNSTATTNPVGKTVTFTYDGSAAAPTNAGSYAVVGTINDTNYQGTANGNLVISKATATITLGSLAATYDGTAKSASATTNPVGKTVTFTYDGSATAPTNAGSYAIVGTINDTNYQGTANGNLVISKATATVTLGSLAATYDGTAKSASATTNPVGKTVTFTYDGSATAPTNAGGYVVVGTINDTNYQGMANGNLIIGKAAATVTLGSLAATYDGTAKSASATTNPVGKIVTFTYDGSATVPINAGSYAVVGTINDTNYQGTANGNLVISKAFATVTLGSLAATYDGTAKNSTATTNPVGKTVTFTYDGSATAPTAAGSYAAIGTINDTNYHGTANGTLVIGKATATVTLGNLAATYDGTAKSASATTNPVGKTVTFTYDGNATAPTNAGSYAVVGTINDTNYQGTANGSLVISKATATVTLGSLAATYDGTAKSASATTNPVGKTVTFTYDGSATAPTNAGGFAVVGTINDTNYQGTANGNLVISKAAATVTLGSLAATYDGTAKSVSATTTPTGKTVTFTYDGNATAPTNASSYAVVGAINDTNYQGTANGNLVISKATATVTLGSLAATYDGTAKNSTATTNPVGKTVTFTYDGSASAPANAGSYAVVGTINDTNYQGTANGNLVISKAAATVTLGSLAASYDGTAKLASATTNPVGKTVTFTYDGSAPAPASAGSYVVIGTINDTNYQGTANGTLVIGKATATVTLGSLAATYDGTAKSASATTTPTGKTVTFTYDGSATVPINAGSYVVVGTISDSNYQGTANGTLVIGKATSTLAWNNPAAITQGMALSTTQLNATAGIPGTFTYTPASGSVLAAGTKSLSVTFTPTDTNNYSTATATVNLNVNQQTYTVTPNAGTGSSTLPVTAQTVNGGDTTSFTVSATAGYGILSVTGCNGTLSGNIYTTGAITGDCSVIVTSVKQNGNGGTTPDPTIADALKALQGFSGIVSLTPVEVMRYDVAPLFANGVPQGDGVVDIADVIMILRRSVGIGSW